MTYLLLIGFESLGPFLEVSVSGRDVSRNLNADVFLANGQMQTVCDINLILPLLFFLFVKCGVLGRHVTMHP